MSSPTLVLRNRAVKAQARHAKSGSFAAPLSQVEFACAIPRCNIKKATRHTSWWWWELNVGSFLQAPPEVAYDRVIKRIAINSGPSGLFLNPPGFLDLQPAHTDKLTSLSSASLGMSLKRLFVTM